MRLNNLMAALAIASFSTFTLAADDATMVLPDYFFGAFIQPDNSVKFGYRIPGPEEPKQTEHAGWWHTHARLRILLDNDPQFRAAYSAAADDPTLQATGVSFSDWSTGSLDHKSWARKVLQDSADDVVARFGLLEKLLTLPIDQEAIEEISAASETKQRSVDRPLLSYCAGASGNVSANPDHPDFPKFRKMIEDPQTSRLFSEALATFQSYLEANPQASIDQRTDRLNLLIEPLLAAAR